jgi:tRNA (adenine57-N1/adenine58-N1)-methyltransferase
MEIDMVEIQHKRIDVRRERVGLQEEGLRGVNAVPASVDEAVARLRQLEDSQADYHRKQQASHGKQQKKGHWEKNMTAKQVRAESNKRELSQRKLWKEGVLCHRSEPELKSHTSYLVFAVLPQAWTEKDEAAASKTWTEKESSQSKS